MNDHPERQLGLGLKGDTWRDVGLLVTGWVIDPTGGHVQLKIDGQMLGTSDNAEADAHLTA